MPRRLLFLMCLSIAFAIAGPRLVSARDGVAIEAELSGRVSGDTTILLKVVDPDRILRHEAPALWTFVATLVGPATARGRFVFRFGDGQRTFPTIRSRPLVLARGTQPVALTFPPITRSRTDPLRLEVAWEPTDADPVVLGTFEDATKVSATRTLTIGWICTSNQTDRYRRAADRWRFGSTLYSRAPFRTEVHQLEPVAFPRHALGLFGFDLLLVTGDAFRDLDERQLAALRHWIEAGGAAGFVTTEGLAERHVDFFEALFAEAERPWRVGLAQHGRLQVIATDASLDIPVFRSGLGVVGIYALDRPPETHTQWYEVGLDLWRVPDRVEAVVLVEDREFLQSKRDFLFQPNVAALLNRLKSTEFEMLPPGLLLLLALVYLLLIGPVDWRLFGRLRRRRWTWIWLPTITVIYAVGIVALTESYFGDVSSDRRMFVVDVGVGGRILRANCFELALFNRARVVEQELTGEVFTTVDPHRFRDGRRSPENSVAPVEYSGSYPFEYTTRQRIPMWSAVINRRVWVPGSPPPDWVRSIAALDLDLDHLTPELGELLEVDLGVDEREALIRHLTKRVADQFSVADPVDSFAQTESGTRFGVLERSNSTDPFAGRSREWPVAAHPLYPSTLDQHRVASPSGGGHADDMPLRLDIGDDVYFEVRTEIDGASLVIRRVVRKAGE